MVILVWKNYFNHFIRPKPGTAKGPEVSGHNLFNLKGVNEGGIPIACYFEMYAKFPGQNGLKWIPGCKESKQLTIS